MGLRFEVRGSRVSRWRELDEGDVCSFYRQTNRVSWRCRADVAGSWFLVLQENCLKPLFWFRVASVAPTRHLATGFFQIYSTQRYVGSEDSQDYPIAGSLLSRATKLEAVHRHLWLATWRKLVRYKPITAKILHHINQSSEISASQIRVACAHARTNRRSGKFNAVGVTQCITQKNLALAAVFCNCTLSQWHMQSGLMQNSRTPCIRVTESPQPIRHFISLDRP